MPAVVPGGGTGVTVSALVRVTPAYVAEMSIAVEVVVALVPAVKVVLVAPAGMVTEAGVVASIVLLLASETRAPP